MPPHTDWHATLVQHDRWLRTVVFARVGERGAVDEVMQEVALAAVREHAPIADRAKVAPWLYRVAVRQSLLYRRRQGRWRQLRSRLAENTPPAEHDERMPDPLAWLLSVERDALVREGLERLPRGEAEILLLKYSENWTYEQLAQHMGATVGAIESRLHRARRRLRRELLAFDTAEVQP